MYYAIVVVVTDNIGWLKSYPFFAKNGAVYSIYLIKMKVTCVTLPGFCT